MNVFHRNKYKSRDEQRNKQSSLNKRMSCLMSLSSATKKHGQNYTKKLSTRSGTSEPAEKRLGNESANEFCGNRSGRRSSLSNRWRWTGKYSWKAAVNVGRAMGKFSWKAKGNARDLTGKHSWKAGGNAGIDWKIQLESRRERRGLTGEYSWKAGGS